MNEAVVIPQVAGELRAVVYLLGGGMTLLILKEVFAFIKAWKKESNTNTTNTTNSSVSSVSPDFGKHNIEQTVAHALQSACLGRMETAILAQTSALIEITTTLSKINRNNGG